MLKILYYILITASLLALFINRKRLDRRLYLFFPLLLLALATELTGDYFPTLNRLHDFLFSIYTPLEYLLLCLIITSFLKNRTTKLIIYATLPLVTVISVYVQVWLKQRGMFYAYLDILVASPLLTIWSLLYFFQLAADKQETQVGKNPMFWISLGNLLFYSGSTFSYSFGGYLQQAGATEVTKEFVYNIARIFNLVLYIFYIIAFLCRNPSKTKY